MSETTTSRIKTVADLLHAYLFAAMRLEHATIPPYLMALYSIKPGTNSDATHILRVVVVEEMLHLTLAANLLNAVGGTPDLTAKDFVPLYPAYLPDGEHDFQVSIQPFSKAAIQTSLNIEQPEKSAPSDAKRIRPLQHKAASTLAKVPGDQGMCFYSIGEFYEEIKRGLHRLHKEMGDALFSGPSGHFPHPTPLRGHLLPLAGEGMAPRTKKARAMRGPPGGWKRDD